MTSALVSRLESIQFALDDIHRGLEFRARTEPNRAPLYESVFGLVLTDLACLVEGLRARQATESVPAANVATLDPAHEKHRLQEG